MQLTQGCEVNYYRRFPGDYARDTKHLSMLQHGAYCLLLDTLYSTGKPLPKDIVILYRICGASTKRERNAVKSVLSEFFLKKPTGFSNNKFEKEIKHSESRIKAAQDNGKAGGRPTKTITHRVSKNNPEHNPAESYPAPAPAKSKTPLPPASGGEQVFDWCHETVAVKLGRRRRLPNLSGYHGARAPDVVAFLVRSGFEARILEAAN